MQTLYKRFSVIIGFALLLTLLVADAFVTRHQVGIQVATAAWVTHTRQVLLELSETESLLKDSETGQRGYLYTGEEKYLAPYNRAISEVDSHFDNLAKLTADNPRQQAAIPQLREQTHAKLTELAQTISLYRSGRPDDARKVVMADTGLNYMIDIRALTSRMEDEENRLSAISSQRYEKSILLTIGCIYLACILAAIGSTLLAYYILREMRLREKHAQELRARAEWFRVTLTSIGDAVIATDETGSVTFLNPAAESLAGITTSSAVGKNIKDIFPIFNETSLERVEDPTSKVIAEGKVVGLANHTVLRKPDGSLTPIADSAAPIRDANNKLIGVVLVFRDVTSERKTQEILRKTEKLAAAARLAATVAHEINNPLEAVVNLVYISKGQPNLPSSVVNQLTMAEQELERIAHITRQTLGFYRDSNEPEAIQLEGLIESVFKLYSNKFQSKKINIERHFGDCPRIRGVQGELKQVVSNLVSNAADAVTQNGTIAVTLACVEKPDQTVVHMIFEDDGPGIPEAIREKIFEPFFTTKQDVGTGLGLWVTKEIIERHGGTIEITSRNSGSHGATVAIVLPALPAHPKDRLARQSDK